MVFLSREGGSDFALLLQERLRKTFCIKTNQKNRSEQVDDCPNFNRWPRGPFSSSFSTNNHGSLAGGISISISRGFVTKSHCTSTQYRQLCRLVAEGHPTEANQLLIR